MQSIYWVLTWACHRKCAHCYDDRFRPYVRDALTNVVAEGQRTYKDVLANLPDDLTWYNPETKMREKTLMILAGGELLIDGVREELFYPALDAIQARYGDAAPLLSIQTTGDVLTPEILDTCLAKGITSISIASIDDYHSGMKGDRKFIFMEKIREMMASRGVQEVSLGGEKDERLKGPKQDIKAAPGAPTFLFFGAQPDLWIGELWPRGRAFANGLSEASYETNFCERWSGAKNFLHIGEAGSEISIEPNGNIFPCCLKTKSPLGSLAEERLEDIMSSVASLPAIQALNAGDPESMGLDQGWDRAFFRSQSTVKDGKGREVSNMCLGCDSFFDIKLSAQLRELRAERLAKKLSRKRGVDHFNRVRRAVNLHKRPHPRPL